MDGRMGDRFSGTYRFSRDDRGRMVVPKKLRMTENGMLYSKFVITIGPDTCLAVFPIDTFNHFLKRYKKANVSSEENLVFKRTVFPNTEEVEVDSHGRILLPQEICSMLGIGKEVIIVGSDEWIEIWDPEKYQNYQKSLFDHSKDALVNFYGGGSCDKHDEDIENET